MQWLKKYFYYFKSIFTLVFGISNWVTVVKLFLGKDSGQVDQLILRRTGWLIRVRGKMDAWSVKETLLDQFYSRYGAEIGEDWMIMDVGAAIGEFTLLAAKKAHYGKVFAFEPFPGSYQLLQENMQLNSISNVEIHNQAIWSRDGELSFINGNSEPLQLSMDPGQPSDDTHNPLKIHCISLLQALDLSAIFHLDLLKLDCEGAEFPILLDAHPDVFERIDRMIMEYHDGYMQHHHQELIKHLENSGYKVVVTGNLVHEELGYLYAEKVSPGFRH